MVAVEMEMNLARQERTRLRLANGEKNFCFQRESLIPKRCHALIQKNKSGTAVTMDYFGAPCLKMLTYQSYHTELKCLARENLLAKEVVRLIPRSNIWRWKKEPSEKYKSFDLNLSASQDYELIKRFSQSKKAKRLFSSYVRLGKFFVDLVVGIPKFHKHVREMKMSFVKTIERVKDSLGLQNVLSVFGISVSTFRQWRLETYTSCFNSIVNRCNRIYPSQLSKSEVHLMKEKLVDPLNQYWPISSVAFQSLRDGSLPLSLNTWYKYAKRLGITRSKPNDRRKKSVQGIRAERPDQIWHADITRFVTADNAVHYIYLVVDNFSRKILSYYVAENVSALIRRETIGDALRGLKNGDEHVMLITDGGPENSLEEYLKAIDAQVIHRRALINVQCSNSMIEAHNKVLKYNYLYRMRVEDGNQLKREVEFSVNDFNNRPHISLNGFTPTESHAGMTLDMEAFRKSKAEASIKRKMDNVKNRCKTCAV